MKDAVQGDEERVARYKPLLSLYLLPESLLTVSTQPQ